jgi:hypothetical protein
VRQIYCLCCSGLQNPIHARCSNRHEISPAQTLCCRGCAAMAWFGPTLGAHPSMEPTVAPTFAPHRSCTEPMARRQSLATSPSQGGKGWTRRPCAIASQRTRRLNATAAPHRRRRDPTRGHQGRAAPHPRPTLSRRRPESHGLAPTHLPTRPSPASSAHPSEEATSSRPARGGSTFSI